MAHHKVIILGSGPAGLTAAIYTARASLSPVLIHGPTPHGQLSMTTEVENYPGFPDGIMGPELMELMQKQAVKFGASIVNDTVTAIDTSKRPFTLTAGSGSYTCDTLIISTGANPKTLGIPGEREMWGFGVSTCATCDGAFFRNQIITVVGGGDSACEEALFLTRFGTKVYLIHRRDELRASKIMQERVKSHEKIQIIWNKSPVEVHGEKKSGVEHLVLKDTISGELSNHDTNALFVAIGHIPNSELLRGKIALDENGYVIPSSNSTATAIPGLFVCGDVQDHIFRQAVTAAGSGCMAAIEAERFLTD
jgi:thioredoxin reductase (NADPH)